MVTDGAAGSRANRGPAAAAANRRALVAAARAVFAEQGFGVAFSAIAKRAGVGQGSLYRHFPTKVALAAAVFEDDIDAYEALEASGSATFARLLGLVAERSSTSAAIIDAVSDARDDPAARHVESRMRGLVERVVTADRDAGRLADWVDAADAELAVQMLARTVAGAPADARAAVADRVRRVLGEGLGPR